MDNQIKRILIALNSMHVIDIYFESLCFNMCKEFGPDNIKADKKRRTIEYKNYYIDFRPAKHEKIAGIRYDYYGTDNSACREYLSYNYRGNEEHPEIEDMFDILEVIKNDSSIV